MVDKSQYKLVSRNGIVRELKEMGVDMSIETFRGLEKLGMFTFRKSVTGHRSFVSRKEAETIKRLIWVYLYDKMTYPDDINDE